MTWFKVDDKLWGHPKWIGLPAGARALWVTAGSYCASNETDGRLKSAIIAPLGGRKRDAEALVEAGLWDRTAEGYQFHDWDQYQPTKAQVTAERDAARERKRRWRETQESRRDNRVTNGARHGGTNNAPTRPDPTRPLSSLPPHATHPPQGTADETKNLSKNATTAMRLLGCPPDDPRLDAIEQLVATHRPTSPRAWLKSVHANGDLDDLLEQATAPADDPWAHMPHDTGGDQ